jgi:hypothetical protein
MMPYCDHHALACEVAFRLLDRPDDVLSIVGQLDNYVYYIVDPRLRTRGRSADLLSPLPSSV